ncbi:MAG TPA: PAS domain S-box protein [Gemmatimonadaceae bacterium]|jgi:PAS domain S-box-containing protein|nr:PAS domain S-box protein [Gemmatimonadaceae bacterium]
MRGVGHDKTAAESAVAEPAPRPSRSPFIGLALALALPAVALVLELYFRRSAGMWSLFYPAILACAWFGGLASGVVATVLSAALVWWEFIPPPYELVKPTHFPYIGAMVFVLMGILISMLVHQHRRNAAELAREHGFLQSILDYSPNAIVIKSLDGRYLNVNNGFLEITGIGIDDARGKTDAELLSASLAQRFHRNDERARTTGQAVVTEESLEVDGGRRDFVVTKFPLRDDAKRIFALCGIWTDITQRKRAEESLRRAAIDLRTAQHVAHVGSWRWDFRTNTAEWSDELYEIFGVDHGKPPSPLDHPAAKLFALDSLARLHGAMAKLRIDGEPFELDLEFTRPDGSTRWCAARGEAARDATDRISGIDGTIADITHIKELERLRDEWTSIVAHDLRQPIGVIAMASEIIPELRPDEREEERAMVERIQSASRTLKRMVDDLMDMSLLEARRLKLEREWLDPEALVRGCVERASPPAHARIKIESSGPPASVCVDAMRIEQVLDNLLSNAEKYGDPKSGIELRVALGEREVEITVTNYGAGIQPGELSRIFDRFVRSKATQGTGVHGLGLGLYISKGIVEAHGGRMWADSVRDKTTFHIALPAAAPQHQAA